ncbi:rhomboid domain-containing protein 3 [Eucyclogobius newberryi]|uniref:rhomboid domain-containing protein 3 n=1 Tax=Eucyclogobius newberryi TaxID=166745 RepID=UPI003B5B2507
MISGWFGSRGAGVCSGAALLAGLLLSVHAAGIQASLSLGPDGALPRVRDVFFYAVSHDDAPSLLVNLCCLLLVGPCQERRWGTAAFLWLSALSWAALPCAYTLVLWVGVGEASRVCGYSAVQLALFTAQCTQVRGRRLLRGVPLWLLPWMALLLALLLLPGTPALLHFCAICLGHSYSASFIGTLQRLELFSLVLYIPEWAYVSSSSRLQLPTHSTSHRYSSHSEALHKEPGPSVPSYHHSPGTSPGTDHLQSGAGPGWSTDHLQSGAGLVWDSFHRATEAELLEDQMLRAGILASLQDSSVSFPHPGAEAEVLGSSRSPGVTSGVLSFLRDTLHTPENKVELPKSSVSSLRLQQLERMGFSTDKAVVALAASKQLEGAVSLLIDDSIGSEAVVVGAKRSQDPRAPSTQINRDTGAGQAQTPAELTGT